MTWPVSCLPAVAARLKGPSQEHEERHASDLRKKSEWGFVGHAAEYRGVAPRAFAYSALPKQR